MPSTILQTYFLKDAYTNHHVNHGILVGRVLQTWTYENDRGVRLLMRRAAFLPLRSDGSSNLVNVVLPEAVTRCHRS
jgi:hypothetical protein